MAMYHVNYKGLRERPNYDELINYLQTGQETIRYPDRFAKLLRESPYLTQLDGQGMEEMDGQQRQIKRHEQLMNAIEQVASNTKQSRHLLQAEQSQSQQVPRAPVETPDVSGFHSAVEQTIEDTQQRANQRRGEFLRQYEEHLRSLTPSADTVRGAVHSLAAGSQAAMGLVGQVGAYAGRNLVENIRATPGAIAAAGGAIGSAANVGRQILQASQQPPARDPQSFTVFRPNAASSSSEMEFELLTGRPIARRPTSSAGPLPPPPERASSSAAAALPPYRDPRQGGVEIDYSTNRTYWEGRNKPYIIEQLRLRGVRLPETASGLKKIKKPQLLEMLFGSF